MKMLSLRLFVSFFLLNLININTTLAQVDSISLLMGNSVTIPNISKNTGRAWIGNNGGMEMEKAYTYPRDLFVFIKFALILAENSRVSAFYNLHLTDIVVRNNRNQSFSPINCQDFSSANDGRYTSSVSSLKPDTQNPNDKSYILSINSGLELIFEIPNDTHFKDYLFILKGIQLGYIRDLVPK